MVSPFYYLGAEAGFKPGPSCSKITMSLVNVSLKHLIIQNVVIKIKNNNR